MRSPSQSESNRDSLQILRERARKLAMPWEAAGVTGPVLRVIEFHVARERYAVEVQYVREVHPLEELTPLPCTPAFLSGIVNLRGRIVPVMDLRRFFDLQDGGLNDLHRIILV